MSYKIYQVGGSVRDEFLNLPTKDYDFVFCLNDIRNKTTEEGWQEMRNYLSSNNYTTFLETKSAYTIRAKFPKGHKYEGMVSDFVMARSDISYNRGNSRMPEVKLGTLYDDLQRRDFTVNAIAKDEDGVIYDPFDGRKHIQEKRLYTPIDPNITLLDDPLRVLRALRFYVTKDLSMSIPLINAIKNKELGKYFEAVVSQDRIKEELNKAFKYNTILTFKILEAFRNLNEPLFNAIFKDNLWLKITNESK